MKILSHRFISAHLYRLCSVKTWAEIPCGWCFPGPFYFCATETARSGRQPWVTSERLRENEISQQWCKSNYFEPLTHKCCWQFLGEAFIFRAFLCTHSHDSSLATNKNDPLKAQKSWVITIPSTGNRCLPKIRYPRYRSNLTLTFESLLIYCFWQCVDSGWKAMDNQNSLMDTYLYTYSFKQGFGNSHFPCLGMYA